MRVLYFHQYFSSPKGAAPVRSYQMARRLVERGHEVTVVCGNTLVGDTGIEAPFVKGRREGVVDGIRVIELDVAYRNELSFLRRAMVFLKFSMKSIGVALREPYNVVCASSTPPTVALPGIAARWLRGKPFVFEVRDLWPELPKAMGVIKSKPLLWALSVLEWTSYRSAKRLIALAPGIKEGIMRRGVGSEYITVIPNSIDRSVFTDEDRVAWAPEGIDNGDFVAIYAGTHGRANGLDAILDAAAVLKERGRSDVKLLFVGDGGVKEDLVARAQADGLDNVVFLPRTPRAKVNGLYSRADVGLQTLSDIPAFYYGTSPNKFFDYVAAGLPVITNYPGWVADIISGKLEDAPDEAGIPVPPNDAVAFAEALEALADDPARREAMARASYEIGSEMFRGGRLADMWVDWVEEAA